MQNLNLTEYKTDIENLNNINNQSTFDESKKPVLSQKKMPVLSSKNKKPENFPSLEDKIESISCNLKYRMATLITQLTQPLYYLKFVEGKEEFQQYIKQQQIQQMRIKQVTKSKEELIEKIFRSLNVCTMFFQRANFQIQRQPLLKTMNIDIRTVKSELSQNQKFLEQYDEMDTEEEKKEWEEKTKDIKPLDPDIIKISIKKLRSQYNLKDDEHLFVTSADCVEVGDYLKSKGWIQINDLLSQIFELKFCLKKKHLYIGNNLPDIQVFNHFPQSKGLTTKFGLSKSMRNCYQICKQDQNEFFPRCYDLKDEPDFEDFIEEFKFSHAEGIIKRYNPTQNLNLLQKVQLSLAIQVMKRRVQTMHQKINSILSGQLNTVVSADEWLILNSKSEKEIEKILWAKYSKIIVTEPQEVVKSIIEEIKKWDPQSSLHTGQNVWVIKPCGLSRGRGVKYFTDLEELLPYVACSQKVDFVAQKGIENILVIHQKKFDIRQWVLVSSLNPLRVWIYNECYVRFCAENYSPDDLKNKYAHLTNNSIAKKSDQFVENDKAHGNMWYKEELADYLKELTGDPTTYEKIIKPQIEKVVINTIRCTARSIEPRKNTFDIYGFDLLIDNNLKIWLIEVNASPTMEKSTCVTEKLVPMMLTDTGKFIHKFVYGQKKSLLKIGNWKNIFQE